MIHNVTRNRIDAIPVVQGCTINGFHFVFLQDEDGHYWRLNEAGDTTNGSLRFDSKTGAQQDAIKMAELLS